MGPLPWRMWVLLTHFGLTGAFWSYWRILVLLTHLGPTDAFGSCKRLSIESLLHGAPSLEGAGLTDACGSYWHILVLPAHFGITDALRPTDAAGSCKRFFIESLLEGAPSLEDVGLTDAFWSY